jgi:L-fuconolactonase
MTEGHEPRAVIEALAAGFGADRLMWGSDFPQAHDRPYAQMVELARDAVSGLPEAEQCEVLGGTARRLWPALAR